ncbi:MAG: MinD/ParA family protein [Spirochaetes bacterium]|nr:MinD/ParA family protein [Spirochaetota bacterium]
MDQAANLRRLVVAKKDTIPSNTRSIAITSGKGGVGKTSLAVSLSIALAKGNASVTLLDADLGLANINVILGIIPKFNLYHVIKGKKKLKDIVIEVPEGIKIIAGAAGFHQLANLNEKQRADFISELSEIANDDFLIVDTGAGVSQNVLSFLTSSDEIIVVTTPEPTAITDAYGIIKSIASQSTDKTIKLIVNRCQSVSEGKRVAQRIINIAGQFLNIKVENLGFVFDDISVPKSVRSQKPFIVSYPKCKASVCVNIIADKIANREPGNYQNGGISGFVKKLFASRAENESDEE